MTYVLTDAALEARDLRIKLRLRDEEILRLKAECQESMDQVLSQAYELGVLRARLEDAGLSTEATPGAKEAA